LPIKKIYLTEKINKIFISCVSCSLANKVSPLAYTKKPFHKEKKKQDKEKAIARMVALWYFCPRKAW
jgi:hypothetical protein